MGHNKVPPQTPGKGCGKKDSVPSYDVPLETLVKKIAAAETEQERNLLEIRLMKELEVPTYVTVVFVTDCLLHSNNIAMHM